MLIAKKCSIAGAKELLECGVCGMLDMLEAEAGIADISVYSFKR